MRLPRWSVRVAIGGSRRDNDGRTAFFNPGSAFTLRNRRLDGFDDLRRRRRIEAFDLHGADFRSLRHRIGVIRRPCFGTIPGGR